jgi:hypothetical protein
MGVKKFSVYEKLLLQILFPVLAQLICPSWRCISQTLNFFFKTGQSQVLFGRMLEAPDMSVDDQFASSGRSAGL